MDPDILERIQAAKFLAMRYNRRCQSVYLGHLEYVEFRRLLSKNYHGLQDVDENGEVKVEYLGIRVYRVDVLSHFYMAYAEGPNANLGD